MRNGQGQTKATHRLHGPYKHGRKFRVVRVEPDGSRQVFSFNDEGAAARYLLENRPLPGGSIGIAVTAYLQHMCDVPVPRAEPRRASTIALARYRLVAFFQLAELGAGNYPIGSLTADQATRIFEQREAHVKPDTLAGELALVRRFAAWCVKQGWMAADPFAGCVVTGPRSKGKPQLRVDSARKFLEAALTDRSEMGTAAAMALLMGLRASEVTNLMARDVDDEGRVLWISKSKTRQGIRRLDVPAVLVQRLLQLSKGKRADETIWPTGTTRHALWRHVKRLCEAACVDVVTPHGLRGTHATLAVGALATAQVASVLGHTSASTTRGHYLAAGAEHSRDAVQVAATLAAPAIP